MTSEDLGLAGKSGIWREVWNIPGIRIRDWLMSVTNQWIFFIKHAGEMDFIPDSFSSHVNEAFTLKSPVLLPAEL